MTEFNWTVDDIKRAQRDFSNNFMRLDCIRTESYDVAIDCMTECIEKKAADVQPVDGWISVDDRLPEIGKSVLVIVSINAKVNLPLCTDLALEMRIGWLDDNGKWGLQFDSADRDEILYWMPLPEPPKDGEQDD